MNEKEKLLILLQQIGLTEDVHMTHFAGGELSKLIVHKKSKRWHFIVRLQKPLPFQLYRLMTDSLHQTFQSIAHPLLSIETAEGEVTNEEYEQYWMYVVQTLDAMSPPIYEAMTKRPLQFEGQKIIRTV